MCVCCHDVCGVLFVCLCCLRNGYVSANSVRQRAKRAVLLSGTPAISRPKELWQQISAIDTKLFGSPKQPWSFYERYCASFRDRFAPTHTHTQSLALSLRSTRTAHTVLCTHTHKHTHLRIHTHTHSHAHTHTHTRDLDLDVYADLVVGGTSSTRTAPQT